MPRFAVTAPTRDANGDMQAPAGPHEVDWYDFTSKPGTPGNAVIAGTFSNWRDGTVAVFAKLATLVPGDAVDVVEDDGESLHYRSASVEDVDAFTTATCRRC